MERIKNFLKESLVLFGKTRSLFYSAVLILTIPLILFATSFYSLSQFEKNFDHLIQTKGTLLEEVFVASFSSRGNDLIEIQEKINKIVEDNQDVEELKVLQIVNSGEGNVILASSNLNEIGLVSKDPKEFLALGTEDGIAGIVAEEGKRFWEVVKKVQINEGQNVIVKTKISLYEVDKAFKRSINRTYWSVILASAVLILLSINYIRLNQYVLMYNKIKEVDGMKDDFISMASHELKTPLTAINGYLDLLESAKKKLNKDEKHYLDNIQNSSTRLKNLVSDILEVSRIEQGRISFEYSAVSVATVSEKVIDTLLAKAEEKSLKLSFIDNLETEKIFVNVDPDRLQQILINLVGNAIKYTKKGSVKLVLSQQDDQVEISVEDTGLGLNSAERESLFNKFNRIKNDQTNGIEGTGLGLWITKQLVEQMKGEISVESIKGKGSRFFVTFKVSR